MLSIVTFLMLLICIGCNDSVSLYRSAGIQVASISEINYLNQESFPVRGSCYDVSEIKMVVDNNEFQILCENSKWQTTLDLSILPEGSNKLIFWGNPFLRKTQNGQIHLMYIS